jgi:phage protein D
MRRCRIQQIKLTPANEAFLEFCENYETADREKYRKAYERLERREAKVKGQVRADGDNEMRDMQRGLSFGIRSPA